MKDLLFEQLRAEALAQSEPCDYCHAIKGQLCVNSKTGDVLRNAPAHWARLKNMNHSKAALTETGRKDIR